MTGPERCQHLPAKLYECTMCLHSALTAAREELAEAKSSRAFSMFQSMKRQRDQAEQRVRELEADLKHRCERHPNSIDVVLCSACDDERHTDAECELRVETIANLELRVRKTQRNYEALAALAGAQQITMEALEQRLAESERVFKRFGDHWPDCPRRRDVNAACCCGFDRAVAAMPPKPAAGGEGVTR